MAITVKGMGARTMWKWNDGLNYLMHYGIKGQKWGVRNYQNTDGTLTPAGKERYSPENRSANRPHSRQKNVVSGKAYGLFKGDKYGSNRKSSTPSSVPQYGTHGSAYTPSGGSGFGGGYYGDVVESGKEWLELINDEYKFLNDRTEDFLVEYANDLFAQEWAAALQLGTATIDDMKSAYKSMAYDLGKNVRSYGNNVKAFDNAMYKSVENAGKRVNTRREIRGNLKQGRTARGYAKVEEK